MNDLISRQELYHEMTVKSMELFEKGLAWHEFRRGFDFAMEFVQEAPSAEPERKWIPVTEALPEEDEEVLVTVRFDGIKDMKGNTYVEVAYQIDGEWSSYSDEYKVMRHRHHVIAWMPLPESYKGK